MELRESIIALRASGATYDAIAAELRVTRNVVSGVLFRAANDGKKTCGRGHAKGERNGNAKLTEAAVKYIRRSAEPIRVLAEKYGITPDYVSEIRYRHWAHVA